jgi:hypothetical protein
MRPRGVSKAAVTLVKQQQDRLLEPRSPDVDSTERLTESLNDICRLVELEDDWDLDGARRIDMDAVRLASQMVLAVELAIGREGVQWQPPEIGPAPDGSIAMRWDGGVRQTLMVFRPGQTSSVECVTREQGRRPIREVVPVVDAVALALWALSDG